MKKLFAIFTIVAFVFLAACGSPSAQETCSHGEAKVECCGKAGDVTKACCGSEKAEGCCKAKTCCGQKADCCKTAEKKCCGTEKPAAETVVDEAVVVEPTT